VGLFGGFNAEKKLAKANEHLERGSFYEARSLFEEILGRENVDAMVRSQAKAGWRHARQGLIAGQQEEAERLIAAGDRETAADCLRTVLEIAGDDIEVPGSRARLEEIDPGSIRQSAADRIMSGIDEAARPEEIAPEEGEAVADFGQSPDDLFEVYMNAFSEEIATRYRAQGDAFRDAYLLLQQGNFEEAIAGFEKLPAPQANDSIVRLEMGQALLFAGKYDEALARIEGLSLPAELEYRRATMAASLLEQAGRIDEAYAEAERLYRDNPKDVEAASIYADLLIQKDQAAEALAIVKGLIMAGDPSPELVNLAARAYVAAGRVEEGRDLLEQSLENFFQGPGWRGQAPRFPLGAARELFQLYIALNEEPEYVRAMAQHLITYDPDNAERYKEALRVYAEAREGNRPEA
jgi:thioredoxin-like negative regulator of GroEL